MSSKDHNIQAMKKAIYNNRSNETWCDRARKFVDELENRISEICSDDFFSAVNYFFDYLLPKAMPA